jgi:hypothetical protein
VPNGEAEYRASARIVVSPQSAPVCFNDSPTDGQAHSHAIRLGGDEWFEQSLTNFIRQTRTGISNADMHHASRHIIGCYEKLAPWLVLHGLNAIPQQIKKNLLHLNSVDLNMQTG